MNYRILGKTGFKVSEVSLGTWQLGAKWGAPFDERLAEETLESAIENGINFFDTADVYSSGQSEHAIGKFLQKAQKRIYVGTKCGRESPFTAENFSKANIEAFVDRSLKNMKLDVLDLIQLHCPPTQCYYAVEPFEALESLREKGKIRHWGVSVEKAEEALKAMQFEGLASIQIIFNMFRQRPAEAVFAQAKEKNVGIIVRVPLASGLLTGKFTSNTHFEENDHRTFNRDGAFFDKGETFSGIDYAKGLLALEELKKLFATENVAPYALKWILGFEEVSCIIPGASSVGQVVSNTAVCDMPELAPETIARVKAIYDQYIKYPVHYIW